MPGTVANKKSVPAASAKETKPRAAKAVRVRQVPAVTRSIAILRLLGRVKEGMGVKAIADELGLIPSTCLHILRVLVSEDLARVDPATKRYALGSGMISLARSVLEGGGFAQLVQPVLNQLASQYSVTAMGVEITPRQAVVVLAISRSTQPFRLYTEVGSKFDELVSATGRLIAAFGGESWAELKKRFAAIPWDKPPTFETWKKEVEQARARGWAVDRDNFVNGLTVVAVPIFGSSGALVYTLVVAGLSSQLNTAATLELVGTMKREAQGLAGTLFAGA